MPTKADLEHAEEALNFAESEYRRKLAAFIAMAKLALASTWGDADVPTGRGGETLDPPLTT